MRRRRRNTHPEHENHERWLVSYADFITLLFAFFVVMYSISSVNDGKYRILSESLVQAFQTQDSSLEPIQIGEPRRASHDASGDWLDAKKGQPLPSAAGEAPKNNPDAEAAPAIDELKPEASQTPESFKALQQQLSENLKELINADLVKIRANQDWLEIDMRSGILFGSGSATLNPEAGKLLADIGAPLRSTENYIRVRGFTDNQPIATVMFPSNWHLSSARATEVVNTLQKVGIVPERLGIEGFGEYQPIADNASPEGRAKNRRVVIAVSRAVLPAGQAGKTIPASRATSPEIETPLPIERLPDGSWQPASPNKEDGDA